MITQKKILDGATNSENRRNQGKHLIKTRPINEYDYNDAIIKKWNSIKEITEEYKICRSSILDVCNNRITNTHGKIFKYGDIENLPEEEWREIFNAPNYYVSNKGRVKFPNGRIKYGSSHLGYYRIKAGDIHTFVHRLVCLAFHGKPPEGKNIVNHIDENKTNNNVENLQWNIIHSSAKKVAQIKDEKVIATYRSLAEASERTGIHKSCIGRVCIGQRKHTGGFFWKYI